MYHLPKTQAVRERFRIAYPQYWLDKLTNEIHAAHEGEDKPVVTGQILGILRHPEAEVEVTIPGAGIIPGIQNISARAAALKAMLYKVGYVGGLNDWHTNKLMQAGLNIVTNAGDIYYAQLAMGDTLTYDFQAAGAGLRLGSNTTAPVKTNTDVGTFLSGSDHVIDGSYPTSNDSDSDNTGAGTSVMTWTYSYLTSEGNVSNIGEGAISDVRAGPSNAVLTHFLFTSVFSKTSSDTLKVIVNHTVLGV